MKSSGTDDSEDDVHQCGRCKVVFHSIDKYFEHKKSKTCAKVKTSSGAFIKESENIEKESSETSGHEEDKKRPQKRIKLDDESGNISNTLSEVAPRTPSRGRGRGRGRRGRPPKAAGKKLRQSKESDKSTNRCDQDTVETCADDRPTKVKEERKDREKTARATRTKAGTNENLKDDDSVAASAEGLLGRGRRKTAPKKAWVDDYALDEAIDEKSTSIINPVMDDDSLDSTWSSPKGKGKLKASKFMPDKSKRKRGRPRKYPLRADTHAVKDFSTESAEKKQCPLCQYSSGNRDEYDRHIRREHNITHWVCDRCGKPFKDKYKVQRHKSMQECEKVDFNWCESSSGKYMYFPPKNPRSAAAGALSDWKAGEKEASTAQGPDSESDDEDHYAKHGFGCQICDDDCKSFEDISEHLKKMHPKVVPGVCKFCGRWFTNKYKVWRHMTSSVHDDIKDVDLNKARTDLSHLKINWKPPFDSRSPVDRKEYPCMGENCQKVFTSRFAWEAHQRVHGTAPGTKGHKYKCDSCDECFSKRKYYQDHLLYEHGIVDGDLENFKCPVCLKTFTQKTHVFRHFETLHTPSNQVPEEEVLKDDVFNEIECQDGKKDSKLYSCFVCRKIMAGYTTFYKHVHQHRVWISNTSDGPNADRELIDKIFGEMNQKRHIHDAIKEGVRIKNSSAIVIEPSTKPQAETNIPLTPVDQTTLSDLVQPQNLFSFLQDVGHHLPLSSSMNQQNIAHTPDAHGGGAMQTAVIEYQPHLDTIPQDHLVGGLPQVDKVPSQGVVHHHPQSQGQSEQQDHYQTQECPTVLHQSLHLQDHPAGCVNTNISSDYQQCGQNASIVLSGGQDINKVIPVDSAKSVESIPEIEIGGSQTTDSRNCETDMSGQPDSRPENGNDAPQSESDAQKLICPYCLVKFPTLDQLALHKSDEHQLLSVFCCIKNDCRMIFHKALDYQNHAHAQKAFVCTFCNDHYESMSDLSAHKTSSHRLFEGRRCGLCNKSFPTKEALKIHADEEKDHFPCNQCGKVLGSETNLKDHVADHLKIDIYLCDICGATFKSKPQLSKHSSTHVERAHHCVECNAQFLKREHLRRHLITRHSNDKPYVCQISGCDKSFKRKDKLQEHYRSHSNVKPYKCEKCGKCYRYREGLRYHEATHQKQAKYFCNFCQEGFVKPAELRFHMKKLHDVSMKTTHSYPCQHCAAIFARPERLKRHMEKEHGVNADWQYICNACNKGFAGDRSLTTHVKRRHAAHSTGTELITAQRLLKKKVVKGKDSEEIIAIKPGQLITGTIQTLDINQADISNNTAPKLFSPIPQANITHVGNVSQAKTEHVQQQPQQQQQTTPITITMATPVGQPIQVQVPTIIHSVPQMSLAPQANISMIQPSGSSTLTTSAAPVSASPMVLAAHSSFLQQIHLANYQPNVSIQPQAPVRANSVTNPGLAQTQVVGNQVQIQPMTRMMMNTQQQSTPMPILQTPLPQAQNSQLSQNTNLPFPQLTTYTTFNDYDLGQAIGAVPTSNTVVHQQPTATLTPQGTIINRTQ